MNNQIKLKRYKPFYKSTGSIYKYKNWYIEDTGINWTVRRGNEKSYQFAYLKDVRVFLNKIDNDK